MKRVLRGLLLGALLLVVAPYSSYAGTCDCGGSGGASMMRGMRHEEMGMARPGHRIWMQLRSLDLDQKQREAIRDIWSSSMKDAVSKKADVRIAGIELRSILAREPVDMQAVRTKLKEIAALQTELRFTRIKAMEDVKAVLTPEQRKKLRENFRKYRGTERSRKWGRGSMGMSAPDGPRGKMQPDMDEMD